MTDMRLLTWLDCHRRAFEFFGGVPVGGLEIGGYDG